MTSILQYVRYATCTSCDKRTGDPGNREPAEIFGAQVPVAQRKKHPPAKTNSETRMKYEPGSGALSRERRASPPKYRAGTVSPLTTATQGGLEPSRFAVFRQSSGGEMHGGR